MMAWRRAEASRIAMRRMLREWIPASAGMTAGNIFGLPRSHEQGFDTLNPKRIMIRDAPRSKALLSIGEVFSHFRVGE